MPRVCALAFVLLAAAAARPTEPAFIPVAPPPPDTLRDTLKQLKTRRAALDRLAGPHEPFDLTYLPRPAADVQALLALRPNVVLAHPDLAPAGPWLENLGTYLVRFVGGAPGGPGLDGLDQFLFLGHMSVVPKPDTGDGKNSSLVVGGNAFVARAARPCDWAAAVRAWFPASEVRVHRGYGYRVVRVNFGGLVPGLPDNLDAALFPAPDGRTLVADEEANVTALLDRLADRRPVTPPPGWDRVGTAAVAVALDNRNKQWVWQQPTPRGPELPGPANRLFLAADHLAAGLDVGPTTCLRTVVLAGTQFRAKHVQQGRREMMERLADRVAPGPGDSATPEWDALAELTDALLKAGKVEATPLGFVSAAEAKGDLFGLLVRAMKVKGPAPSGSAAAALPGFVTTPTRPDPPAAPPPPAVVPPTGDIPRTRSPIPGDQGIPGYLDPAR